MIEMKTTANNILSKCPNAFGNPPELWYIYIYAFDFVFTNKYKLKVIGWGFFVVRHMLLTLNCALLNILLDFGFAYVLNRKKLIFAKYAHGSFSFALTFKSVCWIFTKIVYINNCNA